MNWQVQLISDGLDHWVHQCHNSEISVTATEDLRLGSLSLERERLEALRTYNNPLHFTRFGNNPRRGYQWTPKILSRSTQNFVVSRSRRLSWSERAMQQCRFMMDHFWVEGATAYVDFRIINSRFQSRQCICNRSHHFSYIKTLKPRFNQTQHLQTVLLI
jgi:hypothetical protein